MVHEKEFGPITLIVLVALSVAIPAGAQSIFLEPAPGPGVHLEIVQAVSNRYELSGSSFAAYLGGKARLSPKLFLRAELPVTSFEVEGVSWDPTWQSRSETGFGNLYLGLDVGSDRNGFQGEFGVRLPTAGADRLPAFVGGLTDPVERMEAFADDVTSIFLGGRVRAAGKNGFRVDLRFVPVFQIDSGGLGPNEVDVAFIHSALVLYSGRKFHLGGGLSGRLQIDGAAGSLADRSIYQLGFAGGVKLGSFRPGLQVRFGLDEDMKRIHPDPVFSLSLSWLFADDRAGGDG